MSRTTTSNAQFHINESARAARACHERMMRAAHGDGNPFATWRLYYRPMRLEAFPDDAAPEGWTLAAWVDAIPSDRAVDALVQWFAARTGQIPYLNEA